MFETKTKTKKTKQNKKQKNKKTKKPFWLEFACMKQLVDL